MVGDPRGGRRAAPARGGPRGLGDRAGGPRPSSRRRASSTSATASPCWSTRAASSRTAARQRARRRAAGRRRRHRARHGRRPPGVVVANDPTVKAGSWGARTVEKIVRATERALREELPIFWFIDSRRRAHHRPGRAVPRPPRRRADLPQPGGAVGQGPADLLPVRAVGRRWRVHPELLRHRDHGRGQRLHVPRLPAHGRDGRGGEGHARGDGRRAHALHRLRLRRHPRRRRRRGHRAGQAVLLLPARELALARCPRMPREPPSAPLTRDDGARAREPAVRRPRRHRRPRRRRLLLRDQAALRAELVIGFGRMDGETVGIVANNSAVKGGVLFTDSADKAARFIWLCDAFTIPLLYLADVPGLHDRLRGRARRHHPARRQDGLRGLGGAPSRSSASSCARPTAPASTPWAAPASARTRRSRCPRPGSPSWAPRPRSTRSTPTRSPRSRRPRAPRRGTPSSPRQRREYEEDVDLERLAADLVIDQLVEPEHLRDELLRRLRYAAHRDRAFATKRRGIPPV